MGRIEKTVFISYRRTNVPWALAIYQNLTMHGYDVFFDYQSINSGNFEKVILENIKSRAHFLVILSPSALERCKEPGDWLRREIETAMDEKRNIVPLMLESFDFGSPLIKEALTGKLATLSTFNGLRVYSEYFFEAMDKLRDRYMNVETRETAALLLNAEAAKITETQKTAANEAPPVEKEELTAQEWFERGFVFHASKDANEAIRCYTEAIRLQPIFPRALAYRGAAHALTKGNLDQALKDYSDALRLQSDEPYTYIFRGLTHHALGNLQEAIADYTEGIRISPDNAFVYLQRATIWEKKKDYSFAIADYEKYLELGGGEQNGDQKEVEAKIKRFRSELIKRKSVKKKPKLKK